MAAPRRAGFGVGWGAPPPAWARVQPSPGRPEPRRTLQGARAAPSAPAFQRRRWPDGRQPMAPGGAGARDDVAWQPAPARLPLLARPAPAAHWGWWGVGSDAGRLHHELGPFAAAPRALRHGQQGCPASHPQTWAGACADQTLQIARRSRRLKPRVAAPQSAPPRRSASLGREGAGYDTTGPQRQTSRRPAAEPFHQVEIRRSTPFPAPPMSAPALALTPQRAEAESGQLRHAEGGGQCQVNSSVQREQHRRGEDWVERRCGQHPPSPRGCRGR